MEINTWKIPTGDIGELARRKLEAFARIEEDFITSFSFVQQVHGQRRFASFPIAYTVRYLHALYSCECKDRLLSIPHTISRYDGARCLELLRGWQEGHTADVVAFVHRKLDDQPFGELSRQIEEAMRASDVPHTRRLTSGRNVLLNRNFNLSHALDDIFAYEPEQLRAAVRVLCEQSGHTPSEIDRQLADLQSDVYAYAPSAALARRNMHVMNSLGVHITDTSGNRPGERTDRVRRPSSPAPPYAEETIPGEMTLLSMGWNNPRRLDLANPPPRVDAPGTLGSYPAVPPDATAPMPSSAGDA